MLEKREEFLNQIILKLEAAKQNREKETERRKRAVAAFQGTEEKVDKREVGTVGDLKKDDNLEHLSRLVEELVVELDDKNRALQEIEALYRALFENNPDSVMIADAETLRLAFVNPAACALLGYTKNELTMIGMADILSEKDLRRIISEFETAGQSEKNLTFEIPLFKKDGSAVFVDANSCAIHINGKKHLMGVLRDITKRKKGEEQLRKISRAVEASPATVVITDLQGSIEYVNPKFVEITGYSAEEAMGQNPRILKSERQSKEFYKDLWDTIIRGEEWRGEFCNKKKNGKIYWESASISPVRDVKGEITHFVAVKEDVTERKKTEEAAKLEEERLESLLRLSQMKESSEKKITEFALEAVVKLTRSKVGYLHFYDETDQSLELFSWSKETQKLCTAEKTAHYPVKDAGVWADCVRRRKAVIHNDYQGMHEKKGYPEGHFPVIRHVSVPLFDGERIVAVTGVGNKVDPYDEADVKQLSLFMNNMWGIMKRKRADEDLKKAKEAADAASRAKGAFLANMSHEIRTPMNAVIGMNYLMQKTEMSSRQRGYVEKMDRASHTLLSLINDVLDFSKIEAGRLDLEKIEFSLSEVLDDVANILGMAIREKGLELVIETEPSLPKHLIGDPVRLGQVLMNLANNAVKFTDKGEIVIKVKTAHKESKKAAIEFSVSDTGIGLTEQQKENLFEAFTQADYSTTRKYGGTGLGLAISKALVEKMGGRIHIKSEPGRGSTFSFNAEFGLSGKRSSMPWRSKLKDLKALVVEDNRELGKAIVRSLKTIVGEISAAPSGELAIEEIRKANETHKPFDLVFMDYKLPGIDGIEALKRIRQDPYLSPAPSVIIVTAHDEDSVREKAENAKADGFVVKPVTGSMLLNAAMDFLSKRVRVSSLTAGPWDSSSDTLNAIRGFRLLLVEDNEINRQVATELLQGEGLEIDIAENGAKAVAKLIKAEKAYDAVLMDLQMPVMDGFEATRRIREQADNRKIPIIAMTADVVGDIRRQVLEAGMNDYISKPIDPPALFNTLLQWISPDAVSDPYRQTEGKRPLTASDEPLPRLPGLDIEDGLSRIGGNLELYYKLIDKFREGHARDAVEIREAVERGDSERARRMSHTLKGVSGNLGASGLHRATARLDAALKSEGAERWPILVDEVEK
jgi:two-component system sensor histidine kinase/response regulator